MPASRRMRLLVLLPTSPLPIFSGGRQRMFQTLKLLAPHHELTVLSFWRDEEARRGLHQLAERLPVQVVGVPFARLRPNRQLPSALLRRLKARTGSLPHDVYLWDQAGMREAVNRALADQPIDLIQVEWPYLSTYALAHPQLPSVLITHDIFSVAFRRRADLEDDGRRKRSLLAQADAWTRYERRVYPQFSAVAAMSAADAAIIRERAPGARVVILPNGVDARGIRPGEIRAQAQRLLFVGAPTHPPNLDGACWFLSEIWPRLRSQKPDIKLTLVNLDHPLVRRCAPAGVEITGRLPDLELVYRQADVVIVPLRAGSGTRLKILEAFAYGVPVVSTTIGCEGLDVAPGEHLLVADSAAAFADAILRLIDDRALRRRLADTARKRVEITYDWSQVVDRQEALYDDLLADRDDQL